MRLKKLFIGLILLMICSHLAFAQEKKRSALTPKEVSNQIVAEKLPYTVEIDGTSAKEGIVITLAVDSATIFRCPATPLGILIGNEDDTGRSGIDYHAFQNRGSGFSLRARIPGIFTNVAVDFGTGVPIAFFVRVVEVKGGAKVGDFNGEVVIRNGDYKNELADALRSLKESQEEAGFLKDKIAELEKQVVEEKKKKVEESRIETLKLLEKSVQSLFQQPSVDLGKVRITQLGKLQRVDRGWIAIFQLENRSDKQQAVNVQSNVGSVLTTFTEARYIPVRATIRIAVFIESESIQSLLFRIGTASLIVKVIS